MSDVFEELRQPYVTMFDTTCPFEECRYALFGVPFDATSTWRRGSRYAPMELRRVSREIDSYSVRFGVDVRELPLCDLGDLEKLSDAGVVIKTVSEVCQRIMRAGKLAVVVGGEHTLTLGSVSALKPDALVYMDAHLDLRDEFKGLRLSHATFMRRLTEYLDLDVVAVGVRAVCEEELEYASERGIWVLTSVEARRLGVEEVSKRLRERLSDASSLYVSVDLDVLDPAYAPAVGNPEAEGLDNWFVLELLCSILDERVVGIDLCEYAPPYDDGSTAVQALKILLESLAALEARACSGC